jgi:hypothetical protein
MTTKENERMIDYMKGEEECLKCAEFWWFSQQSLLRLPILSRFNIHGH